MKHKHADFMRDIKFRAWDKVSKEYIPWDCFNDMLNGKRVAVPHKTLARPFTHPQAMESPLTNVYGPYCNPFSHNNLSVEQFTGLQDKNGVDIYEGDIVKYPWRYNDGKAEVMYNAPSFMIGSNENHSYCDEIPLVDCEVIGNIHEKPELLS